MTLATEAEPTINIFRFDTGESVAWASQPPSRSLPADLAADPDQWVWCFDCERTFQVAHAAGTPSNVSCAYEGCAAGPASFWKWQSYCASIGLMLQPAVDTAYPLARLAA